MKFSAVLAALSISSIFLGQTTPTFAQLSTKEPIAYKTPKGQIVVTKLKPKQSLEIKYTSQKGKSGSRKVKTNTCGEALINGGEKFNSLTVDNQEIQLGSLRTKEHPRCKPSKKAS